MTNPPVLAEVWRGDLLESQHRGHAVIVTASGDIVEQWGDPAKLIYPRSSAKMLQALPLLESGAAQANRLESHHHALACASHNGAEIHTAPVAEWISALGLRESDLRCGPQVPDDAPARHALRAQGTPPCQLHNNCSGKHAGFLTLGQHLGAGPEYNDPEHPVQAAVRAAFEDMTGEISPGYGIDGCSAPNFSCTLKGLAVAMAKMATPESLQGSRRAAAEALVQAMIAHPLLVAGEGRACSELMAACGGRAAVKTGAEGVFVAILPEHKLGIALKIEDGTTRASEAAMAALLVRLGLLERDHPAAERRMKRPVMNRRDILTGHIRAAELLLSP
ncbi:asparaginase [Algicella marina]|uniref:Asparaginase n=1 Tax=Algicella marina TaxID=2683284 RepID=A0A6P1T337_9RHOB|nr:asparaginase [Algicella marina]QHQ36427.1 asparaginase [Algicella marina]